MTGDLKLIVKLLWHAAVSLPSEKFTCAEDQKLRYKVLWDTSGIHREAIERVRVAWNRKRSIQVDAAFAAYLEATKDDPLALHTSSSDKGFADYLRQTAPDKFS